MHGRNKIMVSGFCVLSLLLALMPPARLSAAEVSPSGQAASASGPPVKNGAVAVIQERVLTLDQCIGNALKNHPAILAASGTLNVNQSKVGQVRSGYYPQISASGGLTEYTSASDASHARQDQYSASLTLTQNIFDFGKTWTQVTIQQRNVTSAQEDLRSVRSQIVLSVKQAYYGLLQAGKNRDVLKETVMQFEQHLNQARGFFEIGVKSKFDVTKAEVDLSNARLNLIRAENSLKIARVTLNNAMGMPDSQGTAIEDTLTFQKNPITFEEARQKAAANRPDLKSLAAKREASEESISLSRKDYLPTLSGNASYTKSGETYPPEQSAWSAGVTLTFPLFSGFLTHYQVKEAKENLYVLKANEEELRQGIILEVQQAYLNLNEAEERVAVAELMVKQAEENFEIARGRYEAGVGSPIEETDALVALSNAKMNYISALSDYRIAEATLVTAMGD